MAYTHYFVLSKLANYIHFNWCDCIETAVIVCSHSTSMLQGGVSHQTENESVAIPVGDGISPGEDTNKTTDDHIGHPRNGQVRSLTVVLSHLVMFTSGNRLNFR